MEEMTRRRKVIEMAIVSRWKLRKAFQEQHADKLAEVQRRAVDGLLEEWSRTVDLPS